MKLKSGLEPLAEILGPEADAPERSRSEDLFSTTLTGSARLHTTYRSPKEAGGRPFVVAPAQSDLDDFFATVATYYAAQVPISAYVHLIGSDVESIFNPDRPEVLPRAEPNLSQLALLGASLGETAIASLNSVDGSPSASYSGCRRTLAFVLARTAALYPDLDVSVAINRWNRLRKLTGLAVSANSVEAVATISRASGKINHGGSSGNLPNSLAVALNRHLSSSGDTRDVIQELFGGYPGLREILEEMKGPFDGRMAAFLKGAQEIQTNSHGPDVDSLAIAFVCNAILPGSFGHTKVLAKLAEFFPTALIWYGMFAVTSANFDVRSFGNGIISKLMRDVGQRFSFADRPLCDFSLDEFEVLSRAAMKTESLKPSQLKTALVALLPGVDVISRVFPEDEQLKDKSDPPDERLEHASRLLDEASYIIREIRRSESNSSNLSRRRKR